MGKKIKSGSGLLQVRYDNEKRYIGFDISGNEKQDTDVETVNCFRNDASVFFLAANSYLTAFYVLSEQMNKSFEADAQKEVRHLVLPYYFNFRHYVELELKALIIALKNEAPQIVHNLDKLWKEFSDEVTNLSYNKDIVNNGVTNETFEKTKNEVQERVKNAYKLLEEYVKEEPAVEYYRFLFDTKFELSKTIVELDFGYVDKIFRDLATELKIINAKLREIIYLFCTL